MSSTGLDEDIGGNAFESLKKTSYYLALQGTLETLIGLAHKGRILDLGSGVGETTIKLAKAFPDYQFYGTDIRRDLIDFSKANRGLESITNLSFYVSDMLENVKQQRIDFGFIYMLYSFSRIQDPLDTKVEFLKNIFNGMEEDAYLCIADTFVPENPRVGYLGDGDQIRKLYKRRGKEAYSSTYLNLLDSFVPEHMGLVNQLAKYAKKTEKLLGSNAIKREGVYLVKRCWLVKEAQKIGFKVVLNKEVNTVGDAIVLLQKPCS